jgi:predicted CoA-binding protein
VASIVDVLNDVDPVVAVVGAMDSPRKFGNRIYRNLKGEGYRLYPVNPRRATVDGDQTYPSLNDVPVTPDIVKFVVPPARTLRILEEAEELGYKRVWVQPGAGDAAVARYLDEQGFDCVINDCIMVMSSPRRGI